jgi:hypothetical protein
VETLSVRCAHFETEELKEFGKREGADNIPIYSAL